MINKDLKVAVLGAGAMGCLFGGLLAEKGLNVMDLENYLPVFPCSWKNTEEQRKFILDYR